MTDWSLAACAGLTPAQADRFFFGRGAVPNATKELCGGCPITHNCETYGKDTNSDGVWGGKRLTSAGDEYTSPEQVTEIRLRVDAGESYADVGTAYGIDRSTVRDMATGSSWSNIPFPPGVSPQPLLGGRPARVTDDQVAEIRRRLLDDDSVKNIAEELGIGPSAVVAWGTGKQGSHLPGAVRFERQGPYRRVHLADASTS